MANAKKNNDQQDSGKTAKHARTKARKAFNQAKNQARYEANLARVKELGLKPETRDKVVTKTYKHGKKTMTKTIVVTKSLSPAELLRKYEREEKLANKKLRDAVEAKENNQYNKELAEKITALEQKIDPPVDEEAKRAELKRSGKMGIHDQIAQQARDELGLVTSSLEN